MGLILATYSNMIHEFAIASIRINILDRDIYTYQTQIKIGYSLSYRVGGESNVDIRNWVEVAKVTLVQKTDILERI